MTRMCARAPLCKPVYPLRPHGFRPLSGRQPWLRRGALEYLKVQHMLWHAEWANARNGVHEHHRATTLELEVGAHQACGFERRRHCFLKLLLAVEHEKPATAGSGDLSAERSVGPRDRVPLVDLPAW